MSNISKLSKKQKYKNFFRTKLLRKYIIFHLKDLNLVYLYSNLEKHLLSQLITSVITLKKE